MSILFRLLLFKDKSLEFNSKTYAHGLCATIWCTYIELIFVVVVFFLMIKEYHYMKVKHECYFQILLFL